MDLAYLLEQKLLHRQTLNQWRLLSIVWGPQVKHACASALQLTNEVHVPLFQRRRTIKIV